MDPGLGIFRVVVPDYETMGPLSPKAHVATDISVRPCFIVNINALTSTGHQPTQIGARAIVSNVLKNLRRIFAIIVDPGSPSLTRSCAKNLNNPHNWPQLFSVWWSGMVKIVITKAECAL